jgi:hypothetical protein
VTMHTSVFALRTAILSNLYFLSISSSSSSESCNVCPFFYETLVFKINGAENVSILFHNCYKPEGHGFETR